jgi:putative flippase GtrA
MLPSGSMAFFVFSIDELQKKRYNPFMFKKLFLQFCKFGLVGTLCFLIDYGLMVLLTEFSQLSYFRACAISYTVSVVVNYILSMRFVFKGREDMSKIAEILVFVVLSVIGLAFNQLIMWIAVETFHIFYAVAKILATMMVTVYNFISRKVFLE